MDHFILIMIATLPAIALMIYIYLSDNHEREPIGLLLGIFGLGILSCIPSAFFEWLATYVLDAIFGGVNSYVYWFIYAFLGVAIFEEFFKFMAARILTWRNKNFNYKFDGIVYCLFGSMGFAVTENIGYLLMEKWLSGSQDAAVQLGIQRGLLAIPLHAMCAIFMGYYYGNAKFAKSYGNRSGCRTNLLIGFLIATSLHGFYDFCLFTGDQTLYYVFLVFVVVADIFTIIRIIFARKQNQAMYVDPRYSGYWIGPAANPYQPFGGQAAPTYGGYNYGNPAGGSAAYGQAAQSSFGQAAPSPYAPQGQPAGQMAQPSYSQASSLQFTPQSDLNTFDQPLPQAQQSAYGQPQRAVQGQQPQVDMYGRPAPLTSAPNNFRKQMVRCPNCGASNPFNAFYCSGCGSSIHKF